MRLEKLSRLVLLSFVSFAQNSFHTSLGLLIFFKQIFIYQFVITFVIQIQPVLKAKPSILFIFCSNKETRTVKKTAGKQFARAAHVFVHFFAVVFHDYNVKLPETSQLHILWRKCCMWSCSLFFAAALFQLGGRYHFSFSHSCYKIFMLFFKRNWSPQFLCLWLQLFLCYPRQCRL